MLRGVRGLIPYRPRREGYLAGLFLPGILISHFFPYSCDCGKLAALGFHCFHGEGSPPIYRPQPVACARAGLPWNAIGPK
jgi:hypothetical protein